MWIDDWEYINVITVFLNALLQIYVSHTILQRGNDGRSHHSWENRRMSSRVSIFNESIVAEGRLLLGHCVSENLFELAGRISLANPWYHFHEKYNENPCNHLISLANPWFHLQRKPLWFQLRNSSPDRLGKWRRQRSRMLSRGKRRA